MSGTPTATAKDANGSPAVHFDRPGGEERAPELPTPLSGKPPLGLHGIAGAIGASQPSNSWASDCRKQAEQECFDRAPCGSIECLRHSEAEYTVASVCTYCIAPWHASIGASDLRHTQLLLGMRWLRLAD